MKLLSATTLAFCLAPETFAGPVAWKDNSPRSIDDHTLDKCTTVSALPLIDPLCDGYSVSLADISLALEQGADMMGNNVQKAKNSYPHQFKNYNNVFSWANCPPQDQQVFYEWPVLRNAPNPWLPGSNTKLGPSEPDRAIFQANSATTITYCGTITHSGAAAEGQSIQCT